MTSSGNNETTPPDPRELEISIFGPGFGECIVIHLGNGDWGIVDSCIEPAGKTPAALKYLESLCVDVSKSVRFVLATHWHDDHIHGISSVFQAAKSAIFSCSVAIRSPDFSEILSSWTGTRSFPGGSGVDELRAVLLELKGRNGNTNYPTPVLAISNKTIWERTSPLPLVTVKALSPSDAALVATIAQLEKIDPLSKNIRRRLPDIRPNDASVVLAVQIGEQRALLGADLEIQNDPALGWTAIVNGLNADNVKHHGFKVPHHGSSTGHHDGVWSRMLIPGAWAVTTPFVKGNVKLPTANDCKRILNRTANAYLTAPPRPMKFRDSNRTVEKTVNESTISVHFIPGKYGHVRMRKRIDALPNALWTAEMFGNAITMANYITAANA